MKKLIIVRHAKAESIEPGNIDFNRVLSQRGVDEAKQMAERVKPLFNGSTAILTSPAERAFKTARIFAKSFEIDEDHIFKEHMLYGHYSLDELKILFGSIGFHHDNVFVFGHNPTLGEIVDEFTSQFSHHLPTSGVIVIELDIDKWENMKNKCGKITHIEHPKKN
jgi:phosphohistidine phosphatase